MKFEDMTRIVCDLTMPRAMEILLENRRGNITWMKDTPMQIRPGEYKRRDGKKAAVLGKCPFMHEWIYTYRDSTQMCGTCIVHENGRVSYDKERPSDLVAEWREPIIVKGWVNIYENVGRLFHATKDLADKNSAGERVACIYVTGTEGVEP